MAAGAHEHDNQLFYSAAAAVCGGGADSGKIAHMGVYTNWDFWCGGGGGVGHVLCARVFRTPEIFI